ncbi:MAG: hypothetical protein WBA57_08480 [Elainellaceae cyanobacterium]
MNSTLIVIGNGPSLRGFDFTTLKGADTLGMNAAYRFWDREGWYPTHYCCLDPELIKTHHTAIKRLVDEGHVKTAFLNGLFLELCPESAQDSRYVFYDQFSSHWHKQRGSHYGLEFITTPAFKSSQPTKVTTGAYAARYGIHLGYQHIGLIGIDLKYVERIPEAENPEGIQLVMTKTPTHNPNYFFDDYQQKGDTFQVPNPDVHNFDLHPVSFEALRDDLLLQNLNVEIVNCNLKSVLHSRGVFPYQSLRKFLNQPALGALVVPTQVSEGDRILQNLKLWNIPAYAPFLHFQGREKPQLIFTFTGEIHDELQQAIHQVFDDSPILNQCFSKVTCLFFELAQDEDIYQSNYAGPVSQKGFKSGPNQQFFEAIFALKDVGEYAFFMETDCVPIRPDWLGYLADTIKTVPEFWIMGSAYRGQDSIDRNLARHINGNAIYAVGNPAFRTFAEQWKTILSTITERFDRSMAYDCALERYFSLEFAPNPSLPSQELDPSSEGWRLFQHTAPAIRYSHYILNYGGRSDLKTATEHLVNEVRETFSDAYILHNRAVRDLVCDRLLSSELEIETLPELTSVSATKQQSDRATPTEAKPERFGFVKKLLSFTDKQNSVEAEPDRGFHFVRTYLRGRTRPTSDGFIIGYGAGESFVAFRYSTHIIPGDFVRVSGEIRLNQPCELMIALHNDDESPHEGKKKVMTCESGVIPFKIRKKYSHPHTGIKLQFSSDNRQNIEIALLNVTFEYLESDSGQ